MKPSKRQQDIFDVWENEDCNILIKAVAGSGKTTTLLQLLERKKVKTLFLAFNKSIQQEIEDKLVRKGLDHARSYTLHSLGLKAIRKKYDFVIESGKSFKMGLEVERNNRRLFAGVTFKEKQGITGALVAMNDVSRMFLTDDFGEIMVHMESMGNPINRFDRLSEVWDEFLKIRKESYRGLRLVIDFTDMIYVPILKNLRIPTSPVHLMIDEAQDLNMAQHELVNRILGQGAVKKWIAVGDKNQSIYGFSGASSSSFETFATKDNVKELPLDICYRCPPPILDLANDVYNVMEGFKEVGGMIGNRGIGDVTMIKEGSLVICRNTGPLIKLFFYMLGKGRKVYFKGDDILGAIKKFLQPYQRESLDTAVSLMYHDLSKLEQKFANSENYLDRYNMEMFKEMIENFVIMKRFYERTVSNVRQLQYALERLFVADGRAGVTLCTIHKSKGLENPVVYILNEGLIPSKFARTPNQLEQENNLKYVARTRASEEMYFLDINEKTDY